MLEMPQSPELAGGAGFTFEDAVAATYLTALLQEGYAAGVENRTVSRVALQQRDFGEPLDDVIVDFRAADADLARLSLQVKRALTISKAETNTDFRDIVRDSWSTLHKPNFRHGIDRYGAAVGDLASNRGRAFRFLCELARASVETAEFDSRFEEAGNANALVREIRADVVALIEQTSSTIPSAVDVHQFFAHFVLIEFDYLHEGGTSLPTSLNAVRTCLAAGRETDAPAVWATICQLAREEAARSGVFDRKRLVLELSPRVHLAAAPSLRGDLEKIRTLTAQWLADIEDDIGGARLERTSLVEKLQTELEKSRVVQIRGLPGSGKSVLLRRRVETELQVGPVLLLKSGRVDGTGWASFATANGLSAASLENLLVEIGATGSSILYVDGIDRIEKQHHAIVRDVVTVILSSPLLKHWRIVISLRDTGIEPLRNWMGDLLSPKGLGTVEVGELDDAEAELLASARPHLRSLLFGAGPVREIVRRPFFAKVLEQNFGSSAGDAAFQPRSEVDLIGNWWARGGHDTSSQMALDRQRAIIELGSLRARHLEREIAINQLSPSTVSVVRQFVVDGILQDVRPGHSLRFAHDIFFEWAFFHVLTDRGPDWLEEIRACGEPPAVARVVELYSQSEFEQGPGWAMTLRRIEASGMRSQWMRAWLLAPLAAPDFRSREATFSTVIEADEFRFLKKALVWFQAEKTNPNPNILASDLPPEQRIRYADLLGWPSDFAAWGRFITFLLARISTIPAVLFPDMISVFEIWQNAVGRWNNPLSNAILDQIARWLAEMDERDEEKVVGAAWGASSRRRGLGSNGGDPRKSLVSMILRFSVQRPDLSKAYLERVLASERLRADAYSGIVSWSPTIARSHPGLLVDLTLKHLKEELPQERLNREREEARRRAEYRKQVLAKPVEERTKREQFFLDSPSFILGSEFSYHDWDALAVDRDTHSFWPPSPLREPFHSLFAAAPDEALRLVRELSNHAITAWRQLHKLTHENRGTPLPLEIIFPWGAQFFWGGDREYLWHRGTWAPKPVACAYMALEDWTLKELERGRSADELIQQIVTGNECIAVLGAAIAVALQAEAISETIFPLVTSQRLLTADHNRMLHDFTDTRANLIGFTDRSDLLHYEAVKAGNERTIRRKSLRQLLSMFYVMGGAEFHDRTKIAVLAFPDHLPYQLEEHRNIPEAREHLLSQARELAEFVEIENYRRMEIEGDERQIGIVHVSPTATSPQLIERAKEAGQRLREGNLWAWASNYFEKGEIGSQFTVADAIEVAKESDKPDRYEGDGEVPKGEESGANEIAGMRRGAIAAAAAVALTRRDDITAADIDWARRVLERAIHAPEKRDLLWSPMAIVPWHYAIFAAHGLAADLRHGTSTPKAAQNLLMLVAHPLEGVSLAALRAALSLWDIDPRLAWTALFIGFSLCHVQPRQPSGPNAPMHTAQEIEVVLTTAERHYKESKGLPNLPLPPEAWVRTKTTRRRGRSRLTIDGDPVDSNDVVDPNEMWGEPPIYWYSQYAAKILAIVPFDKVLMSEAKSVFLPFLSGLLAWTIAKISPPWLKPGRRDRGASRLYEWTHQLGRALGTVAGFLPLDQVKAAFLDAIFGLQGEHCWDLLSPLVDTYICAHVYDAKQVPDDALASLQICLERMLADSTFEPSSYRAGELYNFDLPRLADALMFVAVEHAGGAERYVNGDWRDIGRILPIVDRFVRAAGWAPAIMSRYLTLCERAKAAYPADQFADQVLEVIDRQASHLKGWHGTTLPARIAGLVQHFAHRETPMPLPLGQKLLRVLDLLVDMGDRRSAALQLSESFREVQTV